MKNKVTIFSFLISASFLLSNCTSQNEEVFSLPGEDENPFIEKELPETQKAPTDVEGYIELDKLPETHAVSNLPGIQMSSLPNEENEIGEKTPISITFDQEMNKKSVQESLVITPDIPGKINWEEETMVFLPEEPFEAGEKYSITLTTDALNEKGENLPQEYLRKFSITDELKILSIIPTNQEVSSDTDISVIFNQPIAELSTIDELEKIDFGITVNPPFPFRYRLSGTNTLQLQGQMPADEYQDDIELTEDDEIEHRLPRSSRFTVTIPKDFTSLNGSVLGQERSFSVSTKQIELLTQYTRSISPFSPVTLQFSQPVNIESVRENVQIAKEGENQNIESPEWNEPIPKPTPLPTPYAEEPNLGDEIVPPPGFDEPMVAPNPLSEEDVETIKNLEPSDFIYEEAPEGTPDDTREYWTEERMKNAEPMDMMDFSLEEDGYEFSYGKDWAGDEDKTRIEIIPSSKFWEYNTSYIIDVNHSISGTEGNLQTARSANIALKTIPFVRMEKAHEKVGPNEEITLVFEQAPDSLDDIWNALEIENTTYALKYKKICEDPEKRGTAWEEDCEKMDDTKRVIVSFLEPLENNRAYTITIKKGLSATVEQYDDENGYRQWKIDESWIGKKWALQKDQYLGFSTPEKPEVFGHYAEKENYHQLCLYTNNPIDDKSVRENLVFHPPLPTEEIYISNYETREIKRRGEIIIENCHNPRFKGKNAVEIRTNLDFTTDYSITLSGETTDIYGQTIGEEYGFSHTTGERTSDNISFRSLSPYQNVIAPSEKEALVVFSSQNVPEELSIDICRKDILEVLRQQDDLYNQYANNPWLPDKETCDLFTTTTIRVPDRSWRDVYTEVNLKEILGEDFQKGAYVVAAHHPMKTWTIYERGFTGGKKEKQVPYYSHVVVQVTDLSLVAKTDAKQKVVWLSRLSDGSPVEKAPLSLLRGSFVKDRYDFTETEIGTTNEQGIVQSEDASPWEYILAKTENDTLVMSEHWTLGESGYGREKQENAYIFTDRPIYRPGDSAQAKITLFTDDDAFYELMPNTKITAEIKDSRRNTILEKTEMTTNEMGSAALEFNIPADASLGDAMLYACIKSETRCFSISFAVEEYKKPEFEITAKPEQTDYAHGEIANIEGAAEYYFGAPLSNGEVDYSLKRQTYRFDRYKDESGYIFEEGHSIIRPLYRYNSFPWPPYENTEYLKNEKRTLDKNGKTTFTEEISLPFVEKIQQAHPDEVRVELEPVQISKTYTAELTAQDSNKNPVYTSTSFTAHATDKLVGVKPEKWSSKEGEELPIDMVFVDTDGNTLSGETASLTVVRQDYISKENAENEPTFRWIPPNQYLQESVIFEQDFVSGQAGKARFIFTPNEAGQYKIVAEMEDEQGRLQRASTTVYIYGKDVVDVTRLTEKRIDLLADKELYNIGDTAKITVLSPLDPEDSKYMLGMERGKLYRAGITEISDPPVLEVPITENMLPNMKLTLLGQQYGDSPTLAFGEVDIVVDTTEKELDIQISTDKQEYLPGEDAEITLKTNGKAEFAIMVVDKANLALLDSKRENILKFFYKKRDSAVKSLASLLHLNSEIDLSAQYEEPEEIMEYDDVVFDTLPESAMMDAGMEMTAPSASRNLAAKSQVAEESAGGGDGLATKMRSDFKDTAFFEAIITTDENGKAMTSFTLPDNLTTWEIFVIGMNADFEVGEQTQDIITKKPLLLRPQLPRFVRYGDGIILRANIHNESKETLDVEVEIRSENLDTSDNDPQTVTISAGESADVTFTASAEESTIGEKAKVILKATSEDFVDEVELTIPVLSYSTPETIASSGITTALSYFEKVRLPEYVEKHIGHLKINTSATLAHFLHSGLDSLVNYPYGCNEQIASKLLGLVIYHDITTLPNIEGKMEMPKIKDENDNIISYETAVQNAVATLTKNQRYDGGWGYWLGSPEPSAPLTAHILHTLSIAKSNGEDISQEMIDDARRYLISYLERKEDLKNTDYEMKRAYQANARAFMLSVLSSQKTEGLTTLTAFSLEHQDLLTTYGKLYFIMHLQNIDQNESVQEKMLESVLAEMEVDPRGMFLSPKKEGWHYSLHGSSHKLTALLLKVLVQKYNEAELRDNQIASKMIRWLSRTRKDGSWQNTQATVAVLDAFAEFLKKSKEHLADYDASVIVDGKVAESHGVNGDTLFDKHEIKIRTEDVIAKGDEGLILQFLKDGNEEGALYYDIELRYYLPIKNTEAREEGITVQREYYAQSDSNRETPINSAKIGDVIQGKITISVPDTRYFVAVESPIPAGMEIVNFRLNTSDKRLQDNQPTYDDYYYEDEGYLFSEMKTSSMPMYDSYYTPWQWNPWVHTEMRDDKVLLFADRLSPGVYTYEYFLQVTHNGVFANPPARAEEMYTPEIFGRTKGDVFTVEEK